MSILTIDMGTTWGYAVLGDDHIHTSGEGNLPPSSLPMGARWVYFFNWLRRTLKEWKKKGDPITAIVYEQPFGRYVNALKIQFGEATIIELEAERHGLEYMGVRPQELKKFATGNGNASKRKMYAALMSRFHEFGEEAPPADIGEDEVDAIWLALYVQTELRVAPGAES